MRPLSAFSASASALGSVHANWTVRSMGVLPLSNNLGGSLLFGASTNGNGVGNPGRATRLTTGVETLWLAAGYVPVKGWGRGSLCIISCCHVIAVLYSPRDRQTGDAGL